MGESEKLETKGIEGLQHGIRTNYTKEHGNVLEENANCHNRQSHLDQLYL